MRLFKFRKREKCFRCGHKLEITDRYTGITFYKCTNCSRPYAKKPDQTLTDRWLSPISLVLYEIIFETDKVSEAKIQRVVEDIKKRWPREKVDLLIEDAKSELENPKQKLVDMHDLHGGEDNARDFLRRLVNKLQ